MCLHYNSTISTGIPALETKISNEDTDNGGPEEGRIILDGRGNKFADENAKKQTWMKLISNHKSLVFLSSLLMIEHW
jgi:hypothetical protein